MDLKKAEFHIYIYTYICPRMNVAQGCSLVHAITRCCLDNHWIINIIIFKYEIHHLVKMATAQQGSKVLSSKGYGIRVGCGYDGNSAV